MALTVADIRTGHLNGYLARVEAATLPWSDTDCNTAIAQAIAQLWPMFGILTTGTVVADETSPIYTIPGSIKRVSRIALEFTDAGSVQKVDNVTSWRYHSSTQVYIEPPIATNSAVALRFWGYKAYNVDATDLPDEFASLVAQKAASIAWGQALGKLANYEAQMALDSGKIVTHQDAVALSAYWQRQYEDWSRRMPGQVGYAPRAASR